MGGLRAPRQDVGVAVSSEVMGRVHSPRQVHHPHPPPPPPGEGGVPLLPFRGVCGGAADVPHHPLDAYVVGVAQDPPPISLAGSSSGANPVPSVGSQVSY